MTTDQKLDPAKRDAIKDLLLEQVRQSTKSQATGKTSTVSEIGRGKGPRAISRRAVLLTAAAAAAVVGMVAVDVVETASWSGGASAAAAEVLESAAVKTIDAVDPVVAEGQYLKVSVSAVSTAETVGRDGKVVFVHVREDRNTYIPGDSTAEWVLEQTNGQIANAFGVAPDTFAQLHAEFDYEESLLRAKDGEFYGPNELGPDALPTPEYVASLPREPKELLSVIREQTKGKGQSANGQVLVFMTDLLRTYQVPADLRAALYRAAALVPGFEVSERQATVDGRTGVAIGYLEKSSGIRHEIVIAPDTGLMIGERSVKAEGDVDLPAGSIMGWSSTKATVADSAP